MSPDDVLFISLDSCRYDSFEAARLPTLTSVGPLHRAQAPSHFTYGSHAAMFVGFTPGVADKAAPFVNPKFARLFRLDRAGHEGVAPPGFLISGDNIVDGFRRAGYATLGTAAMGWFSPATSVSGALRHGFETFDFAGGAGVQSQVEWLMREIDAAGDRPTFAFVNVGETHVPYHFIGAPWDREDNPCVPFQTTDRSAECRMRQVACIEYVDRHLAALIDRFRDATILICADHGDCWGEDGLWEHGISHEMTLTVPLIIRYRGQPI
jgi:hypothetical protein